jgi:hypothetical protein
LADEAARHLQKFEILPLVFMRVREKIASLNNTPEFSPIFIVFVGSIIGDRFSIKK